MSQAGWTHNVTIILFICKDRQRVVNWLYLILACRLLKHLCGAYNKVVRYLLTL